MLKQIFTCAKWPWLIMWCLQLKKIMLKTPAVYRYTEVLPRTFLATAGIGSWSQEYIFLNEPVRRMIIAISTSQSYLGTKRRNTFHYAKFILSEIVIYRNGLSVVWTTFSTTSDQRVYVNTLEALDFLDKSFHGTPLVDYPNHFILAFDLTSKQEASHFWYTFGWQRWNFIPRGTKFNFLRQLWTKITKNSVITYRDDG